MSDTGLRELFIGWFDYYADRATERLIGLADAEYLWEPAPNVPAIAWRMEHISSMLSAHELRTVAFGDAKIGTVAESPEPASASAALARWEGSIAAWKRDIAAVTEERLWEPLGPEAAPYSDDPVASFIEHIHDEFIHHSAEIALLRDLYRERSTTDG